MELPAGHIPSLFVAFAVAAVGRMFDDGDEDAVVVELARSLQSAGAEAWVKMPDLQSELVE